jgi:hypothetical protein
MRTTRGSRSSRSPQRNGRTVSTGIDSGRLHRIARGGAGTSDPMSGELWAGDCSVW